MCLYITHLFLASVFQLQHVLINLRKKIEDQSSCLQVNLEKTRVRGPIGQEDKA